MHAARPYGRFPAGSDLSEDDARAVEHLARNLTNFKQASALDNLKQVMTLPSGRQAIAVDMGGTFRIFIDEPRPVRRDFDGRAVVSTIPMLYSGAITKARVREGEGVGIRLTEQARRRIADYDPEALPPKDVELQRFRIEYPLDFSYFRPEPPGIYTWTQYLKLRPTWYSGTMAAVVQIVAGYGRQRLAELPENPVERAALKIPEPVRQKILVELQHPRLPGYTGEPDEDGWIRYDYRFFRCNGVAFDSSGAPWLLQVKSAGVFAMPLPTIPATTTNAFRAWIEEKGDQEILSILDTFGGMPTGENFPVLGEDFEAWRRAGAIIKVCNTADFYEFEQYYIACGWSFNSRGTEAFNTCRTYTPQDMLEGYAYKMSLRLVPAQRRGLVQPQWHIDQLLTRSDLARIDAYMSSLYSAITENSPRNLAIKYKVARQSGATILERADGGRKGSDDVEYWNGLEAEPIAAHSGNVRRVGKGPLYWPEKHPHAMGKLKFPELSGQGCESFPMNQPYTGPAVRSDTIVFGCYVEDQLKVIKWFYDPSKYKQQDASTFEDLMIVGQWEQTITMGDSRIAGHFYTTDFDDRSQLAPTEVHTEVVGRDLGYGNPRYHSPPLLHKAGWITRSRYYTHETTTSVVNGPWLDIAVCVPVFERDGFLYAYEGGSTSTWNTAVGERHSMEDPNYYGVWTFDFIFHYIGSSGKTGGGPDPKNGIPVYLDEHYYAPSDINSYADSGNWWPFNGVEDVTHLFGRYTQRGSSYQAGGYVWGGEAPGYQEYRAGTSTESTVKGRLHASISGAAAVQVHESRPHGWYFSFSPYDDFYFYRDACRIAFGDANYTAISEQRDDWSQCRWGHSSLAEPTTSQYFIGVIHE